MGIFGILSDILIGALALDAIKNYINGNKKITKRYITYFVFLLGFIYTLKFIFNVPRQTQYFDPFAFPSGHTALSTIIFAVYKNPILLGYAIIVGLLRILGGYHSVIDIVSGFLFGILGTVIVDILEKKIGKEAHRKLFHIGVSSYIGFLLYINHYLTTVLLGLALVAGILLYFMRNKWEIIKDLLEWYDRDFTGRGAFTLVLGLFLVSLLWDKSYISAFFLAWTDGLSTIVGKLFRTKRKSFYGLIGGILGSLVATMATKVNFIIGIIVAIVEYITPKKLDDNIVIPLIVYVTYTIMQLLL